jgi:hypothetical protein
MCTGPWPAVWQSAVWQSAVWPEWSRLPVPWRRMWLPNRHLDGVGYYPEGVDMVGQVDPAGDLGIGGIGPGDTPKGIRAAGIRPCPHEPHRLDKSRSVGGTLNHVSQEVESGPGRLVGGNQAPEKPADSE